MKFLLSLSFLLLAIAAVNADGVPSFNTKADSLVTKLEDGEEDLETFINSIEHVLDKFDAEQAKKGTCHDKDSYIEVKDESIYKSIEKLSDKKVKLDEKVQLQMEHTQDELLKLQAKLVKKAEKKLLQAEKDLKKGKSVSSKVIDMYKNTIECGEELKSKIEDLTKLALYDWSTQLVYFDEANASLDQATYVSKNEGTFLEQAKKSWEPKIAYVCQKVEVLKKEFEDLMKTIE